MDRCLDLGGVALTLSAPERHDRPRWLSPVLAAGPVVFLLAWFVWPVGQLLSRGLRPEAVMDVIGNPGLRRVAWFTLWQAAVSTVATVLVGLAPAWVLARFRFRGRQAVRTLVMVPFVLPTVVVGAAFLAVAPDRFDRSITAILAAHVFFNVAVVVRTVGGLWEKLDPDLTAAARTLGATAWGAFRRITLPLLWPAIVAAASIVFLFTVTSFGVIRILGGPSRATVEVEIYLRAAQLGDLAGASALAALQMITVGALLAWWSRVQRRATLPGLRLQQTTARPARTRRERMAVVGIVSATVFAFTVPLAALIARSVRVGDHWTLAAWRSLGRAEIRPGVPLGLDPWGSVWMSLRLALAAMIVSLALGVLTALAIVQLRRRAWLLDTGIMLPLGTSAVTIGFGIVITYDTPPLDLRSSIVIVPLVHALVAVPFVVRTVLPVLRSVPGGLLDAAATLGASPWQVWRRVEFPLVRGAVAASAGFAFAVSLGEFGATSLLTRRGSETLPVAIDRLLGRTGDLIQAQGFALATLLLGLTVIAIAAVDGLRPLRGGGW